MSRIADSFIDTVPWSDLQDAYGAASNVPQLLEKVAAAKGAKLYRALDELCSHILHQGTIYSASAPTVHVLLEMLPAAAPAEKVIFYGFLSGMAESAKMAIEDGPAPPCHAGGDPKDGEAIRAELRSAASMFTQDLSSPDSQIRALAAPILSVIGDRETAALLRDQYLREDDSTARHALLDGLIDLHASLDDWPSFIRVALRRESDPENRLRLRCAELQQFTSAVDDACVHDLVSCFVQSTGSYDWISPGDDPFFESIPLLGRERELAALLKAFELAKSDGMVRVLAERLLRLVFDDQRTGWGQTASSRLKEDGSEPPQTSIFRMALRAVGMLILYKLFPFARRWHVRRLMQRKPAGVRKVEYWGLKGARPEIPRPLSETQRTVLAAFAAKPELWQFRTNLWELFGLPDNAAGMSQLVRDRSADV